MILFFTTKTHASVLSMHPVSAAKRLRFEIDDGLSGLVERFSRWSFGSGKLIYCTFYFSCFLGYDFSAIFCRFFLFFSVWISAEERCLPVQWCICFSHCDDRCTVCSCAPPEGRRYLWLMNVRRVFFIAPRTHFPPSDPQRPLLAEPSTCSGTKVRWSKTWFTVKTCWQVFQKKICFVIYVMII